MSILRRWWLTLRLRSLDHDIVYLHLAIENKRAAIAHARRQRNRLWMRLMALGGDLPGALGKIHEHRDTIVGWCAIAAACVALWFTR